MVSAAGRALAPPPGVAEAAAGDAHRGLRKVRARRPRTALVRSVPDEAGYQAEERGFDPDNTVSVITWRRKDRQLLTPGDQLWLAAPRRSRGRRRSPYVLIRAGDHRVFWAFGRPLPGDSNW